MDSLGIDNTSLPFTNLFLYFVYFDMCETKSIIKKNKYIENNVTNKAAFFWSHSIPKSSIRFYD